MTTIDACKGITQMNKHKDRRITQMTKIKIEELPRWTNIEIKYGFPSR
jgi:hypothetical protein